MKELTKKQVEHTEKFWDNATRIENGIFQLDLAKAFSLKVKIKTLRKYLNLEGYRTRFYNNALIVIPMKRQWKEFK